VSTGPQERTESERDPPMRQRLVVPLGVFAATIALVGVMPTFAGIGDARNLPYSCAWGAVAAKVDGKQVCLRAGQRCERRLERQYHRYGFHCHAGRLRIALVNARPAQPQSEPSTCAHGGPVAPDARHCHARCGG
jgi:hypothetical protein